MHDLQMLDAWNHAYGIPPDSVEAEAARQRVAARLAAAELDREWYGSMPSDTPGIERAIAVRREQKPMPADMARILEKRLWDLYEDAAPPAKPSISGLLVTAGERWK